MATKFQLDICLGLKRGGIACVYFDCGCTKPTRCRKISDYVYKQSLKNKNNI